ncbi:MAG: ABC transporter ATP-binding protein [Thermodesulfobacteriota bacterium]
MDQVIQIKDLKVHFQTPRGPAKAVDGVSLRLAAGQVMGLVGESGCGKSALALSLLRLLPTPPALFAGGEVWFQGRDLLRLSLEGMRKIRGNRISMIFQEPMSALNPVFTVGNQLTEVFRTHQRLSRSEAKDRAVEMIRTVGVPAPERRIKEYPHQLSGGMRQRVMIAMALACRPALLLADEPTTALDVTIQAQILDLMLELKRDLNTTILLITHDLGVVAETAERVAVMYTGRIVEEAGTESLYHDPLHPYTQGLMEAIPSPDADLKTTELKEIKGVVPNLLRLPPGCSFEPRCSQAEEICRRRVPPLIEAGPDHKVACWLMKAEPLKVPERREPSA